MADLLSIEELKKKVGEEIGLSDWVQVDQGKINQFADCTGDHQWIHVDIEKAKAGPFGGPIAHGFLTLSHIPVLSASRKFFPDGIKMAVNYGLNKVRFLSPVPAGAKIRSRMILTSVEEKSGNRILETVTHNIEIEGQDKPACIAESLSLFYV